MIVNKQYSFEFHTWNNSGGPVVTICLLFKNGIGEAIGYSICIPPDVYDFEIGANQALYNAVQASSTHKNYHQLYIWKNEELIRTLNSVYLTDQEFKYAFYGRPMTHLGIYSPEVKPVNPEFKDLEKEVITLRKDVDLLHDLFQHIYGGVEELIDKKLISEEHKIVWTPTGDNQ